jgi:sugar phosphate isomerase/epimerase
MARDLRQHIRDCAINTATLGFQAPITEVIDAVARAGFGHIAPWRREVEGQDVHAIAQHIRDAGLAVSGYCRSTSIPSNDEEQFLRNIEDNKRAIEDAAILGSSAFVMVVGGLPEGSRDLGYAREQVTEACGLLHGHAKSLGVRLGLEPLHPVYAADRSCLTLISEALDMCNKVEGQTEGPVLGVVIDCYHVWWDPGLADAIARAGRERRIFGFHVCDWLVPTQDVLLDRGMMGDGVIDIRSIRALIEESGYRGAVEVEIFSDSNWWKRPMSETLTMCHERLISVC